MPTPDRFSWTIDQPRHSGAARQTLYHLVASQFEILPYTVLEAMSVGCPIVASRVGGIPEPIADGENGLLFESQCIGQLTAACRQLLENHTLAASFGAQARKDCLARFTPKTIASETISAYQAAIDLFHRAKISP